MWGDKSAGKPGRATFAGYHMVLGIASVISVASTAMPFPAHAQVNLTLHGGLHAARLDRPERSLEQPARSVSLLTAPGEATALGVRAGGKLAGIWLWDGGVVWSRNRSALGSSGPTDPAFETQTIFASTTAQARLTREQAKFEVAAGAGPALIVHAGSGVSLLSRQVDFGGLLTANGILSIDGRLGIRLDVQEYLFRSSFLSEYRPAEVGAPAQPAGSRFRHEFVFLAGLSWSTR